MEGPLIQVSEPTFCRLRRLELNQAAFDAVLSSAIQFTVAE